MAKNKTTRPAKVSTSARGLAKAMGVSHSTVSGWTDDPRWRWGKPPWIPGLDPVEVERWRQEELTALPRGGEGTNEPSLNRASVAYKLERTLLLRIKRQQLEGKVHDSKECASRRRAMLQVLRNAFLDLGRSLAPSLVGRTEAEIERLIDNRVRGILEELGRA